VRQRFLHEDANGERMVGNSENGIKRNAAEFHPAILSALHAARVSELGIARKLTLENIA